MPGMADVDRNEAASVPPAPAAAPKKPLTLAAERALADQPAEHSGRGGLDPVRYGDWEVKGVASDF